MFKARLMTKWILYGCAGLTALADPGDGIRLDNLTLHPFVSGSVVSGSNVGLTQLSEPQDSPSAEEEAGDVFLELRYGLKMDYQRETVLIKGSLYGYERYYQDLDLDNSGFGQSASLDAGSKERVAIRLSESYYVLQDYALMNAALSGDEVLDNQLLEDRSDRLLWMDKRDVINAGINLSRQLSAKMNLGVSYTYSMTDYDDIRLFDASTRTLSGDVSWAKTAKTDAFLTGTYGVEDSDALDLGEGEERSVMVGMRTAATQKINYDLGVGYLDYVVDGLEDIDQGGLNYAVGIGWTLSPKLALQASADKSFSTSAFVANNAREVQLAQVALSYRFSEAMGFGAALSFR
ncbi:MAG: outer membrane beta-barrel protein, partial [Verrucomicrobiota bacterium]